MDETNILFLIYLNQIGIISNNEFNGLKFNTLKYSSKKLIKMIKDYLYNDNNKVQRCNLFYDTFIELDNIKIKSILKKIFIIYIHKIKEIKLRYIYKWNKIIYLNDFKQNLKIPFQKLDILMKNTQTNFKMKFKQEKISKEKSFNQKTIDSYKTSNKNKIHLSLLKELKPQIKEKKNNIKKESIYKVIPIPKYKLCKLKPYEKMNFFTNLSNSNIFKEKKIQKLRENLNKDFEQKFTFSPNFITKNNKKSLNKSFSDNKINNNFNTITSQLNNKKQQNKNETNESDNINYIKRKKEKLNKIFSQMTTENGITFKPKLNDDYNSKKIKENFIERYNNYMKNKENEFFNDKTSTPEIDKECTFYPKINYYYYSNNLLLQTPFEQRLEYYQKEYENHIQDIKNKYSKSFTFKPSLSDTPTEKENISKIIYQNSLGDNDPKKITFSNNYFNDNKNKNKENQNHKSDEIQETDEENIIYN